MHEVEDGQEAPLDAKWPETIRRSGEEYPQVEPLQLGGNG